MKLMFALLEIPVKPAAVQNLPRAELRVRGDAVDGRQRVVYFSLVGGLSIGVVGAAVGRVEGPPLWLSRSLMVLTAPRFCTIEVASLVFVIACCKPVIWACCSWEITRAAGPSAPLLIFKPVDNRCNLDVSWMSGTKRSEQSAN